MKKKIKYNPEIHHRRSIRLKGYDYSQPGYYFVTICVQKRLCLFGEIIDGMMKLNDAGLMIEKWWKKLSEKYDCIRCDEYTVMPNHFHGIIKFVGADPCVHSDKTTGRSDKSRQIHHTEGQTCGFAKTPDQPHPTPGQTRGFAPTDIPRVVQWFKTMSTNEYIRYVKSDNWKPFIGKLWQRNYWEHVIRNDDELNRIREYIQYNPQNWFKDKLYVGAEPCARPKQNIEKNQNDILSISDHIPLYGEKSWMI